MDVRDDASVSAAAQTIVEREQRIDVVINNAGFGIAGAIEDTSIEEAKEQFEVNLFGAMRVCRAVLPIMRKQRSGLIINMSSIAGLIAVPYQGLYSASKFALEGFTEALRYEIRQFGVRVVLIEPGDHRTRFTENRRIAGGALENAAYKSTFERAVNRMAQDEQNGPGPERIARLVAKVIHTRRPRLRYTVGPLSQRAAVWIKRLTSYSLTETLVSHYYLGN
jgi:short-subunit dehydrogenase